MCWQSLLSSNCTPSLARELPPPADTNLIFIAIFKALHHCTIFLGTCEWILHGHKWSVTVGNEPQQIPQRKAIENRAFVKTHRCEGDTPECHYWVFTTWKFCEPGQQAIIIYLLASGTFQQPPTHIFAADAKVALEKEITAASVQVLPATFTSSTIEIQKASSNGVKRNNAAVPVSTSPMTIKVRLGLVSHNSKVIKGTLHRPTKVQSNVYPGM